MYMDELCLVRGRGRGRDKTRISVRIHGRVERIIRMVGIIRDGCRGRTKSGSGSRCGSSTGSSIGSSIGSTTGSIVIGAAAMMSGKLHVVVGGKHACGGDF